MFGCNALIIRCSSNAIFAQLYVFFYVEPAIELQLRRSCVAHLYASKGFQLLAALAMPVKTGKNPYDV